MGYNYYGQKTATTKEDESAALRRLLYGEEKPLEVDFSTIECLSDLEYELGNALYNLENHDSNKEKSLGYIIGALVSVCSNTGLTLEGIDSKLREDFSYQAYMILNQDDVPEEIRSFMYARLREISF